MSVFTIDSHQHFWKYNSQTHAWINEDMAFIRRDFLPTDIAPIYEEAGIAGCVAVQADQSDTETNFLLSLAKEYDWVKAVVGWVDPRSKNVEEQLSYYSQYPEISGFRHIVQGESDPNFLLRKDFIKGISCLEKYNFTYDILVFPHQLGAVLEFVRLFPNQKFVIDHLAKPYIKDGFFDGWANQMKAIAKYENVWCKVSGMVTESDWQQWKFENFVPYLDLIFEAFGPNRLLYGSDCPVCLVAGDYLQVKGILDTYLKNYSEAEKELIFAKNAIDFYGIKI